MLSSSSYLPAIDIHKINILIDYLYKTELISKHLYNILFTNKENHYKHYVVIKLKKD